MQVRRLNAHILMPIRSIADCGCGNGFFQHYFEQVFGVPCVDIDFSTEMLRINPCANKICASVMALPFPDNSFDLVTHAVCFSITSHVKSSAVPYGK